MSKNHKIVTISPSGNLYGSENVLFDYLCTTELNHFVFVPKNSQFEQKLKSQKWNHRIKSFNPKRLELFYANLILFILTSRIKSVYVNEGGHYKWIKLISKLFKGKRFFVHLRMIFDANIQRIGTLPSNVKLIAISKYVAHDLNQNKIPVEILYDGFMLSKQAATHSKIDKVLKVGVIGRISTDKGINRFYQLIKELEIKSLMDKFEFHFYGSNRLTGEDLNVFNSLEKQYSNINYRGFQDPDKIYKEIQVVLHLNTEEGLGRVFLESIANGIPFIGFDTAGISEIGGILDQRERLLNPNEKNYIQKLTVVLLDVLNNYESILDQIHLSQGKVSNFDIIDYSKRLDIILSKKITQ